MRPERHNAVKLLLFLDVGGSMDPFIRLCEELFSAATTEFKNMEFFYFHNCLYEGVWKDNRRRFSERIPTWDILHKYGHDYKVIFVGDAAMSPYEISYPGGSVEHMNEEPGAVWMSRLLHTYPAAVWLNPTPRDHWDYSQSTRMIREIMSQRMYPLTLEGIDEENAARHRDRHAGGAGKADRQGFETAHSHVGKALRFKGVAVPAEIIDRAHICLGKCRQHCHQRRIMAAASPDIDGGRRGWEVIKRACDRFSSEGCERCGSILE